MVCDITRVPDEAAYASNWWRILAIDLCIGLGITAAGVALALAWSPLAWALAALGAFYAALVVKRIFKWRALRASRGNSTSF
jgi:hypothetical protein